MIHITRSKTAAVLLQVCAVALLTALLVLFAVSGAGAAGSSGGSMASGGGSGGGGSPGGVNGGGGVEGIDGSLNPDRKIDNPKQEIALMKYNSAQDAISRAFAIARLLESDLSKKESAALIARRIQHLRRAVRDLENAVRRRTDFALGHKDLGYALRSLGDYDGALAAYDRAIEIEPGYPEAIEYRAVAYLHLSRFDDVQDAYLDLVARRRNLADLLMGEMKEWVRVRAEDSAMGESEALQSFDSWLTLQSDIAEKSRPSSSGLARNW